MKILLIGPFPYPVDGCSLANDVLFQNLVRKQIVTGKVNTNTDIVSSAQGQSFSIHKSLSFLKKYSQALTILRHDAVYLTPGQTFFGLLKYSPFIWLCQLFAKPYIIHVHGNHLGEQYRMLTGVRKRLFHQLLSHASAGIVLSRSLVRNFEGLLPTGKIYVVENFVTDVLYQHPQAKTSDVLRVLYLSNLIKEKGILDLLDALLLLDQRSIPFSAVIAGSTDAHIEAEVALRLAQLKHKVSYAGVISGDEKMKELWKANVFVLPTYYPMEGQPISLLEGLATGNIIVTTRHSGIPDVITEKNGFFVDAKSAASIAECLELIAEQLPAYVHKFSQANIDYAASVFTEKQFTERVLDVIGKVL